MSNDSTNLSPQHDDSRFSWSSNVGILLSPFLWVAVVGAGFIIYTLWPDGSDKGSVVGDEGNSAGWLDSLSSWLADNDMMIAALVAVVITLVAIGAGTKKVWKREAVVTEWMVYAIAVVGIAGIFYYLGTEYLYGDGAEDVRQKNLDNIAAAFDPRIESDEKGLSIWWYVGGILIFILIIAGIATSKDAGKELAKALKWPLVAAILGGLALGAWHMTRPEPSLAERYDLPTWVLLKNGWTEEIVIPKGLTVEWPFSVLDKPKKDPTGCHTESIQFFGSLRAGQQMPLTWKERRPDEGCK